jgi:hypothetical protein
MTPQEKQKAITHALNILKPSPEQREACRQDIAHTLDRLDQPPASYKRMLKRSEFLRRATRINRTLAEGDNTMALPQSLLDELVERDKKLRAIHKILSPGQWRKQEAVIAACLLLLCWRTKVEHRPQGDSMYPWCTEDLSSTKDKDWYRLSSILYGKLTKDGKPADLRRQMRKMPGWLAHPRTVLFNLAPGCVDSSHVPVRTVTVWKFPRSA